MTKWEIGSLQKLPKKFTRSYGDGLSNPVFIKPPDGTEWKMYWTKQNDEVWFEKGWKEFVENYSLDHGYLVLFKYEGTSRFDVLILDQSALEIDYPSNDNCDEKDDHNQSDDESFKILGGIPQKKKTSPKSPLFSAPSRKKMKYGTHKNMEISSNKQKLHAGDESDQGTKFQKSVKHQLKGVRTTQRTSSSNWPKEDRAQEVAKKFVSYDPFFTMFIKPAHLSAHVVNVTKFVNNESKEQNVIIQLGKRSWPVKWINYGTFNRFSSGWSLFATESKLRAGDVCIFELIDKQVPLLEVHVF
ncbi:B3 domain-containing transcription factor VRN1-like [Gastrolobium bilobum]|uniref:B3 domain-containing transcription factor VRN1-like n=1 Tax=Gastrolobium bilobum TaxID=150636 RepID=UPI002AB0BFEE|nr:B3 domain-containing transcription factor VRN1-like [Gastrolobium bilobum]